METSRTKQLESRVFPFLAWLQDTRNCLANWSVSETGETHQSYAETSSRHLWPWVPQTLLGIFHLLIVLAGCAVIILSFFESRSTKPQAVLSYRTGWAPIFYVRLLFAVLGNLCNSCMSSSSFRIVSVHCTVHEAAARKRTKTPTTFLSRWAKGP
jgi:hypothetical protein